MNEKNLPSVRKWGGKTVEERFLSKIKKTKTCWLWKGGINNMGYGVFTVGKTSTFAHRYCYQLIKGEIPDGLVIDHLCKVTSCVNPDHLEPVTMRENLLRGNTFQAKNKAKTHCPSGHEYNIENTLVRKDGSRYCRECNRILHRAWWHNLKK